MESNYFVVVGAFPKTGFAYEKLPVNIHVEDVPGQLQFTARITQMIHYPAIAVPEFFARLSHGVSSSDLYNLLMEQRVPNKDGMVTVWLFEKCE